MKNKVKISFPEWPFIKIKRLANRKKEVNKNSLKVIDSSRKKNKIIVRSKFLFAYE